MIATLILAAAMTAPENISADKVPIQNAAVQRYGPDTRLTSILVSGPYAVIRGSAGAKSVHDGLMFSKNRWHIVCELSPGASSRALLESKCGFSSAAATQLSADEVANAAAEEGRLQDALASERVAFQVSAPATKPADSARLALLSQLNQQMNLGQISRSEAIIKWNEMKFSVFMP